MIILRQYGYSEKKNDHKAEIATGIAGLGTTVGLGLREYKNNVEPYKSQLKYLNNNIDSAKDILDEINTEIRQKGGYDAVHYDRVRDPINPEYQIKKFKNKHYRASYIKDSGSGQLERAEDSMARYDKFKSMKNRKARNAKKAEHELDKAEKRAKKALEYFEKDKKTYEGLKKSGLKKMGIIGASGAALTAGTIAGIRAYKKHKKEEEEGTLHSSYKNNALIKKIRAHNKNKNKYTLLLG